MKLYTINAQNRSSKLHELSMDKLKAIQHCIFLQK